MRGNRIAIGEGEYVDYGRERPQQVDDVVHSTKYGIASLKDLVEHARRYAGVLTSGTCVEEIVVCVAVQAAGINHKNSPRTLDVRRFLVGETLSFRPSGPACIGVF